MADPRFAGITEPMRRVLFRLHDGPCYVGDTRTRKALLQRELVETVDTPTGCTVRLTQLGQAWCAGYLFRVQDVA